MSDKSIESIKYSLEDIERVFAERVKINPKPAALKAGIVCEWVFTYPNGSKTANVECAFCVDPKNNDYAMGCDVCNGKIKIEECAFFHCENLREAYLVHSLRVYQYAFYGCKNLTIFCNANIRPVKWSKKFNWINRSFLLFYKKKCRVIWGDDSI